MFGKIAFAAEWKVAADLDQGVEYNDNIALRSDAASTFGYLLRPSFSADWNTKTSALGVTGRGDIRRYDDQRWDCENFSVGLNQRYLQPRNVFSLAGNYAQNCSYSQQISDTGILVPGNQSENYSLTPAWNWQWTPRDRLSVSPAYSQTSYSSAGVANNAGIGASFRSNENYSLNVSETHQWDHRLSFNGSLFFSHTSFSSSGSASSQDVFGFQLGGQYALSRAWSVNAGGGGRWIQRPSSNGSVNGNGNDSLLFTQVANLELSYKARNAEYSLAFSRSVNPSAFGQLLEYNSVNTKYSYQISREWFFNIAGSVQKSQSIGQGVNQLAQDRTYYTASTELEWKFAKQWRLSASYRYRRQEYPNLQTGQAANGLAGAQDSNALMLHLKYNWDGLRISR